MNNQEIQELKDGLAQFYGTEHHYKHPFGMLFTDGVKFLAEKAGAYWLLDIVCSLRHEPKCKREEFLSCKLKVNLKETSAVFTADDGNGNIVYTQKIEYTDFPLEEITLFFTDNVCMLPSEY